MAKIMLKRYLISCGILAAIIIINYLLGILFTSVLLMMTGYSMPLNIIFSCIRGIAFAILLRLFIWETSDIKNYNFIGAYDFARKDIEKSLLNSFDKYCLVQLQKGKRISPLKVIASNMPYIIFSIICIILLVANAKKFNDLYEYANLCLRISNKEIDLVLQSKSNTARFVCISLPCVAVVSFAKWIYSVILTRKRTCKRCGAYLSHIEVSIEDFYSYDNEEYRTIDNDKEIGGVYDKRTNDKLATVYRKEKETQSRKVSGWGATVCCECKFCGQKSKHHCGDANMSSWK